MPNLPPEICKSLCSRAGGLDRQSRQEVKGAAGLILISAVKYKGPSDHSALPAPEDPEVLTKKGEAFISFPQI